jgi:hypothetical protein
LLDRVHVHISSIPLTTDSLNLICLFRDNP